MVLDIELFRADKGGARAHAHTQVTGRFGQVPFRPEKKERFGQKHGRFGQER